jgi:hypothetical protein
MTLNRLTRTRYLFVQNPLQTILRSVLSCLTPHADTPIRPYADTPIRRHADTTLFLIAALPRCVSVVKFPSPDANFRPERD